MKLAPLFGLLLLPMVAFGKDTAYQALRLVGSERDKDLLNRVVELKGRNGAPQPDQWVILIDDPNARGGLRELEVSQGRIISERTPVSDYSGGGPQPSMNFTKLNLDSQGAFTVAEAEARKARRGFNSIDYFLRQDEQTGSPIWVLQLLDGQKRSLGSITVAADTGNVIKSNFEEIQSDASYVDGGENRKSHERSRERERVYDESDESDEPSVKQQIKGTAKDVGHSINKTFHKVGGSLEKFFTGKRTVDEGYRD